jgi:hypothetical protein
MKSKVDEVKQAAGRSGYFMRLHSGRKFWVTDPRPEDIFLVDIAHALACQNRFAGHTYAPYSVAQHSVHVSEMCDPADAIEGLFHDASEAYVVDIPRPLKCSAGMKGYKPIEVAVDKAIRQRFDLKLEMPSSVKRADELIVQIEMRDLMSGSVQDDRLVRGGVLVGNEPEIKPWSWFYAKERWLARYLELGGSPQCVI